MRAASELARSRFSKAGVWNTRSYDARTTRFAAGHDQAADSRGLIARSSTISLYASHRTPALIVQSPRRIWSCTNDAASWPRRRAAKANEAGVAGSKREASVIS